jgi:cytoskeletal protein RodZ
MNKPLVIFVIIVIFLGVILLVVQSSKKEAISTSRTDSQNQENTGSKSSSSDEDTKKPYTDGLSLTILAPQNNSTVTSSTVIVSGKTSPGAEVAINDTELRANGAGDFSTAISLDEGENPLIIVANDAEGNSAEKEISVTYSPKNQ